MSWLAEHAFSERSLGIAWKKVQKRESDDGNLAPSILKFQEDAEEKILRLSEALLDGSYKPYQFTEVDIETNGKERTLHIPAVQDRIVARAILATTTSRIDPLLGASAFGYRPGLGVADAVQAVVDAREAGLKWVLRTDVDDCFPSLSPDIAFDRFTQAVHDTDITDVVEQLLGRTVGNGKMRGTTLPGLPLGCPLSPVLMNLVLVDLDDALNAAGFTVVRYADDIVVVGESKEELEDAARFCQRILRSFNMQLGDDKTDIMTFDDGFAFLGEDFGPKYPPAMPLQRVQEPENRVLYLGAQTAHARISKGRLIVEDRQKGGGKPTKLFDVPCGHVSRIVAFGSVAISSGLRSWAMYNGVDIVLASRRGSYLGIMQGTKTETHSARLIAQVEINDTPRQLEISCAIIRAKIHKQIVVLQRFSKRESEEKVSNAITNMRKFMTMLDDTASIDEAMGLEGAAAKEYFAAYGALLPNELAFTTRSRQPPLDLANASLSFLYTVLLGECVTALRAAGMDPGLGVLHNPQAKRPSLALDLLEEFRPLVADQVVLNAARRNRLTSKHARKDPKGQGILLTKKGREEILKAYEERMLQVVKGSIPDFAGSIRRHLYRQAQRLAGAIMHDDYEWSGMSWR
ncbi:CRISPR-associated endonuclease Cas1 [Corynebacterium durum]|uniref:CRISPR-associated endonuclease Cas1 n=1 Tax=Corynebacterium durum F0235 TaxID=1035195 RepID=L1MFC3_9CORY|nr:CRISPR-associated endonuclease Cas1 [Corynebacterium durum]EKX89922.1 CRISPR-associated endonuclease Cas1 [Corynebacterium durum F0235]